MKSFPNVKNLALFAIGVFGILSQLFALFDYAPPIALDKLLNLSVEQITFGMGVVLAFMAPLPTLATNFVAMLKGTFQRDNAAADAAYEKLQADFADVVKQLVAVQAAVASQTKPASETPRASSAPPPAQSGRMHLRALLLVAIVGLAGVFSLQGCAGLGLTAPKSVPQTLAYTEASVTAVRQSTLTMLQAGQISTETAIKAAAGADQAMAAIRAARVASAAGDLSTAQAQLLVATQILTTLQAALPTSGR